MTRETKVGMAVATTFLCLVGLVVASKLRRADPMVDPVTEVRPLPEASDSTRPPGEESEPPTEKAPAPSPVKPPAPPALAPLQPADVPASSGLPKAEPAAGPPGTPFAAVQPASLPQPLMPADVKLPMPVADVKLPMPMVAPDPVKEPPVKAGPTAAPSDPLAAIETPAAIPKKLPMSGADLPAALPFDPLSTQLPKAEPTEPAGPMTEAAKPKDTPLPAPVPPVLPPPLPGGSKNLPAATPDSPPALPAPVMPPAPSSGLGLPKIETKPVPSPADPIGKKEDVKLPFVDVKAPATAPSIGQEKVPGPPPLTSSTDTIPPAPKTSSIGTIGTIGTPGQEAPVTPPVTPTPSVRPLGNGLVPVIPAAGKALPPVKQYAEEKYFCRPEDTSFDQLSQKLYGSSRYGRALLEYNRRHVLAKGNLQQDPPALQANQAIYYPPANILEIQYASLLANAAPLKAPPTVPTVAAVPAAPTAPPAVKISTPTPLTGPASAPTQLVGLGNAPAANPPTADATVTYRVPQALYVFDIARQTLGDGRLWTEILRLNPSLHTELPIPAGTELRLPRVR